MFHVRSSYISTLCTLYIECDCDGHYGAVVALSLLFVICIIIIIILLVLLLRPRAPERSYYFDIITVFKIDVTNAHTRSCKSIGGMTHFALVLSHFAQSHLLPLTPTSNPNPLGEMGLGEMGGHLCVIGNVGGRKMKDAATRCVLTPVIF